VLAAKRPPLHTHAQNAVDLPKLVQVVCRFQADELLDRLPSAYLVDAIALHPPCARDRLQQSQVTLAQRPKDPRRQARILLRLTQALRPYGLIPTRQGHARLQEVITAVYRSDRSEAFRKSASRQPEPWHFGVDPRQLRAFLAARGLGLRHDFGAEEHQTDYLRPVGRRLEVSEIERVAIAVV